MRDDIGPNSDNPWPEVTRNTNPDSPRPGAIEGQTGCAVVGLLVVIPTVLVGAFWLNGPQPPTLLTLPRAIGLFVTLAVVTTAIVSGVAWLLIRIERLWDRHAPPGMKSAARAVDRVGRLVPDERTIFALVFGLILLPLILVESAIGGLFRQDRDRGNKPPGDPLA